MTQHQEKWEVIDENCLRRITPLLCQRFSEPVANEFVKRMSEALLEHNTGGDWTNSKISLIDNNNIFNICSGNGNHHWVIYTADGETDMVKSVRKQYLDEFVAVPVIHKRVLGKAIIKYVGNEGVDADSRKEGLRILLQATIDYIQTHAVAGIWENATVTVYDLEDNTFKFQSGSGKNKFIVTENGGKTVIKYTVNNQVKELSPTNEKTVNIGSFCERLMQVFSFGRLTKSTKLN